MFSFVGIANLFVCTSMRVNKLGPEGDPVPVASAAAWLYPWMYEANTGFGTGNLEERV